MTEKSRRYRKNSSLCKFLVIGCICRMMNIITDREARANEILLHAIYEGTGCLDGKRVEVVRGRKIPKGTRWSYNDSSRKER